MYTICQENRKIREQFADSSVFLLVTAPHSGLGMREKIGFISIPNIRGIQTNYCREMETF